MRHACRRCKCPAAGLLADYLDLLVRKDLPGLDDTNRLSPWSTATRAKIAACLTPSANRIAEARFVTGLDLIWRDAATSRSQLYRLLDGEGGVGSYIQKIWPSEAFPLLCRSSHNSTIAALAEALCFADSSSVTVTTSRPCASPPCCAATERASEPYGISRSRIGSLGCSKERRGSLIEGASRRRRSMPSSVRRHGRLLRR